ncbi:MAG TPA: fimbrial protein [Dyella sp.]|uniref:fimbrial protein n=1 Tax=Dyella sp. TaxID=1869338 RepID=UPI002F921242
MNRKLPIALALSLAFGLAASAASASNTITVKGELTNTTCNVVGGQGLGVGTSADFTVTLPTLNTGVFKAPGDTAGRVPFTLSLSGAGCADDTTVSAHFSPVAADVDVANGTLKNQDTGSNIRVQFLDGQNNDTPIDLAKYSRLTGVEVANNKATLVYAAQYYSATATATAGAYSSTMEYDIDYN